MLQWQKTNDVLGTVNRGNPSESGLCTLCRADCAGRCETWLSSLVGRRLLYPRDYGWITAGSTNTTHLGVNYNALRIRGYLYGAHGLRGELSTDPDDCVFPNVCVETSFGNKVKTRARVPLMTGALGSTFVAARYWESFAIGAALVGIPIVVGENVVGIDREAVIENGRIQKAPEMDRRVETFLRYYDGCGAILVQMNVEDTRNARCPTLIAHGHFGTTCSIPLGSGAQHVVACNGCGTRQRNGVAEYLIDKFGDKVTIELKWGQGAKDIGGEIQVDSYDYALFLRQRGYVVDPDPTQPGVKEAFERGQIRSFARHSRLGYTDLASAQAVRDNFMKAVDYLRGLGYPRITLKTGSYGLEALAMAVKYASDAQLDLLTIDGSGGGTGMSPWNMMETWGVPSLPLHAKSYEYAKRLADKGVKVVDLAFAGGLAREDHIFKALALGAPFAKLVCMGRALMIPGYLGSNIEGVLRGEKRRAEVNGLWDKLPKSVAELGETPDQIFASYYEVEKKVGKGEMKSIPFGAIALWTLADKLAAGLQQLLAGARKFSLCQIARDDLFAANRETAEETGIPYISEAEDDKAIEILDS